jgi:hypothetical protein
MTLRKLGFYKPLPEYPILTKSKLIHPGHYHYPSEICNFGCLSSPDRFHF